MHIVRCYFLTYTHSQYMITNCNDNIQYLPQPSTYEDDRNQDGGPIPDQTEDNQDSPLSNLLVCDNLSHLLLQICSSKYLDL